MHLLDMKDTTTRRRDRRPNQRCRRKVVKRKEVATKQPELAHCQTPWACDFCKINHILDVTDDHILLTGPFECAAWLVDTCDEED